MSREYPDPGWKPKTGEEITHLSAIRGAFLLSVGSPAVTALALIVFYPFDLDESSASRLCILAGLAAYSVVRVAFIRKRSLGSSADEIVQRYRSRSFYILGTAATPSAYGLITFVWKRDVIVFIGGMLVTAILLAIAAPTRRSIRRDQERLDDAGVDVDLGQQLSQRPHADAAK